MAAVWRKDLGRRWDAAKLLNSIFGGVLGSTGSFAPALSIVDTHSPGADMILKFWSVEIAAVRTEAFNTIETKKTVTYDLASATCHELKVKMYPIGLIALVALGFSLAGCILLALDRPLPTTEQELINTALNISGFWLGFFVLLSIIAVVTSPARAKEMIMAKVKEARGTPRVIHLSGASMFAMLMMGNAESKPESKGDIAIFTEKDWQALRSGSS